MIILCDVDGVLCNFAQGVLDVLGEYPPRSTNDITSYNIQKSLELPDHVWHAVCRVIDSPGYASRLHRYGDAFPLVEELRKIGEVFFVTSPWRTSPTWAHDRFLWLQKNFDADRDHVIFTEAKHMVRGDVVIDDNIKVLDKFRFHQPNTTRRLVKRPYNPHGTLLSTIVEELKQTVIPF